MTQDRGRIVRRILIAALVALLPVVLLAWSPWSAATGMLLLGMLPTLNAAAAGTRSMAAAAGVSAATGAAAVLITGTDSWLPLLGTLLIIGLSAATGLLVRHGMHATGAATIAFAAYLMVDPRQAVDALHSQAPLWQVALLLAVAVLLGCLWAIVSVGLLLRGIALPAPVASANLPYGVLMAVLCGAFMLVCLIWFRGTNAWWAVMTVAVILQPSRRGTSDRIGGRVAGTLVGGVAAALAAQLVPWQPVIVVVAMIASLAGAMLVLIGAPYWRSAAGLTAGVVLLTFDRAEVLSGDLQRIVITLIAAAATAAIIGVASLLARSRSAP